MIAKPLHVTLLSAGGKRGTNEGPSRGEHGLTCAGCKHLAYHDYHYPYCDAMDAPNQHAKPDEYAYPWQGAGVHIVRTTPPHSDCPYTLSTRSADGERG